MLNNLLDLTIKELFPHIFKRPYFFVEPFESISLACACLISSIEYYVDGLIVIEDTKPIGRILSKDILLAYYKFGNEIFNKDINTIMLNIDNYLTPDSSFKSVVNDIIYHKVGLVPVVDKCVIGIVTIYDVLKVLVRLDLKGTINSNPIYSKIITINGEKKVRDLLDTMLRNNVRRVFIKNDGYYYIDDRDLLDFIISNFVMNNKYNKDVLDLDVELLNKRRVLMNVRDDISIKDAILLLLQQPPPAFLLINDEYILTPWDVVMKGISRVLL